MHALRLIAALSVLFGTAHAQRNLPSESDRIGSSCKLTDGRLGVCKKFEQCQEVLEEYKKRIQPTICFFDHLAAVPCCPLNELSSTSQLTSTVTTPSTPIPPTTKKPTKVQPDECHDLLEDWSPSPEEERSLLQLAQKKCVEYRQHVYQMEQIPSLLIGERQFANRSTCAMTREPLIIGGVAAFPKEFPHMAVIGFGDGKANWNCGGSLISSRHILTAAHCVWSKEGCAERVLLGALLLNETTTNTEPQEFNIVRRFLHPRYKRPERYNDIAIFELDRDVSITGYVRPACLYDTFTPPEFDKGIATGFGYQLWSDTVGSNELKKVTLPFQPYSQCNRTFKANFKLPNGIDDNGMLCAGNLEGKKDTCLGDSGGPLQVRDLDHCMYKIIGVTSFGTFLCGAENSPAIYTRVSSYIPWISKIVWI